MSISTERWSITELMESTWSGDVELEGLDALLERSPTGPGACTTWFRRRRSQTFWAPLERPRDALPMDRSDGGAK
jgi:hypothetical protein